MMKCKYCDAEINENNAFCSNCGKPISGLTQNEQPVSGITKLFAALSYLNIGGLPIFLIPLIARRKDKFVRFHTIQGVILYAISIAESIPATILRNLFPSVSYAPKVVTDDPFGISYSTVLEPSYSIGGLIIHWIFLILEIVLFVLIIIGIVNVVKGKKKAVIGKKN